jgi:hypothetical protein
LNLQKEKCDANPEKKRVFLRHIFILSNIGALLVQSAKNLETANLSIMECYSVMQCLENKIQQRIWDRILSNITEKILNCLNPPLQKCAADDFVNSFCCLRKYIYGNFELSNANPVHCLLPLNLTLICFRHLQAIAKQIDLDFVNMESQCEAFSSTKCVVNMVRKKNKVG